MRMYVTLADSLCVGLQVKLATRVVRSHVREIRPCSALCALKNEYQIVVDAVVKAPEYLQTISDTAGMGFPACEERAHGQQAAECVSYDHVPSVSGADFSISTGCRCVACRPENQASASASGCLVGSKVSFRIAVFLALDHLPSRLPPDACIRHIASSIEYPTQTTITGLLSWSLA